MSLVNCNVHADAWNLRGMPLRHVPAAGQVRLCPAVILPDPVNLQHNVFETAGLHGAGIFPLWRSGAHARKARTLWYTDYCDTVVPVVQTGSL